MKAIAAQWVEVIQAARSVFQRADLDNNGVVDPEELGVLLRTVFDQMDLPKQFSFSDDQVTSQVAAVMETFDHDRSGDMAL